MTESEKSDKRVRRFFYGMYLIIAIELIIYPYFSGREIHWAILECLAGFEIVVWLCSLNEKPFM